MADIFSKEIRSKNMKAIRSISQLEKRIAKELWHRGVRFRRNSKDLFGKPDISIKKYKIVIFIDSCFWHGCPLHCRIPTTNREYWSTKIEKNKLRDLDVSSYYRNKNWNIMRIWEHQFKESPEYVVNKILWFIKSAKYASDDSDLIPPQTHSPPDEYHY